MPIPNDYRELLKTLADRTEKGEVRWKLARNTTVELTLGDEHIAIWGGTDERTEEGFVSFALKDKDGENLDLWYLDADDEDFAFFDRVYAAAKRHALGIPDRLARIRELVSKSKTIGADDDEL